MDATSIARLEKSFNLLAGRAQELVDCFCTTLFEENPALRTLFPVDLSELKRRMYGTLVLVIGNLRHPERYRQPLLELGAIHAAGHLRDHYYPIVRDTFLGVIMEMSGESWNTQLERDWRRILERISQVMQEGRVVRQAM